MPSKRSNSLNRYAGLGRRRIHADTPAVAAVIRCLRVRRLPSVATGLEVAGNARLERQAHATIPEPPPDMAALFDRPEQWLARADARDEDPALERGDQARVVLAGTSTVAGSVRALDRRSTISTASFVSRR